MFYCIIFLEGALFRSPNFLSSLSSRIWGKNSLETFCTLLHRCLQGIHSFSTHTDRHTHTHHKLMYTRIKNGLLGSPGTFWLKDIRSKHLQTHSTDSYTQAHNYTHNLICDLLIFTLTKASDPDLRPLLTCILSYVCKPLHHRLWVEWARYCGLREGGKRGRK